MQTRMVPSSPHAPKVLPAIGRHPTPDVATSYAVTDTFFADVLEAREFGDDDPDAVDITDDILARDDDDDLDLGADEPQAAAAQGDTEEELDA